MDQIIEFTQSDFTELVEGVTMLASIDENTLADSEDKQRFLYAKNLLNSMVVATDISTRTMDIGLFIDTLRRIFVLGSEVKEELKEANHAMNGSFIREEMLKETLQELKDKIIRDLGDPNDPNHIGV